MSKQVEKVKLEQLRLQLFYLSIKKINFLFQNEQIAKVYSLYKNDFDLVEFLFASIYTITNVVNAVKSLRTELF